MEKVWTIVALFVAALVLAVVEILTPMFGVLAFLGLAAMVAAIWLTYTLSPVAGTILTVVAVPAVAAYLYLVVKILPRSPLGRRMFLSKARKADAEATPEAQVHEALVGKIGTTESPLHPTGAVRVDGRRVIASSESGLIEKGRTVEVIRAAGMNLVVRETQTNH